MQQKYSQEEIECAEEIIYSHIARDYNARGDLDSANEMDMPTNLTNAILYESSYNKCTWGESDWTNLSANGCRFSSCDFYTDMIHNAALQHTLFDNAVFYNCEFSGSNFAYSTFTWSIIKNCPINGSAFTGAVFDHVLFQDAKIAHSNFELCKFQNTEFNNVDLSNVALKYTIFHNVRMNNVILPFMQIPYIFGGLKHALSSENTIDISTTNDNFSLMSVTDYKKILPQLIIFFSGHNEYFPLANCYLVCGQHELAEHANEQGIINSATSHDFRKLYFFCLQATQELDISKTKRCQLYNKINQLSSTTKLSRSEYLEFRHYFPVIKQLMHDNPHNKPTLLLSFHTNIASDDFINLGRFMRILDDIVEEYDIKLDSKRLEIRHNSPNVVDWLPVGDTEQLLQLLQNAWSIMRPILSDVASIATLTTALYGLIKSIKKKYKGESRIDNIAKAERKLYEAEKFGSKDTSEDKIETLKLRIKMLNEELLWQKREVSPIYVVGEDSSTENKDFIDRIESLKSSGIHINTLEVQLFDEQCDTLDMLYNNNIELI